MKFWKSGLSVSATLAGLKNTISGTGKLNTKSQKKKRSWKTSTVISGIQSVISGIGLVFAYQCVYPSPVAYARGEYSGKAGKVEIPKGEIKFGNIGLGPMYVHRLEVENTNGEVLSLEEAFEPATDDSYQVTNIMSTLFGEYVEPRGIKKDSMLPLVSIAPRDPQENNDAFFQSFIARMAMREIRLVVTTSCSTLWPLSWVKHTHRLPIPATAAATTSCTNNTKTKDNEVDVRSQNRNDETMS